MDDDKAMDNAEADGYSCIRCDSLLSPEEAGRELCKFCYETHLGNILNYSKQYQGDTVTLAKGLCQALNILYSEIRKIREGVRD